MLCCSVPESAGSAARGPRLCEVRRPDPPQVRLRPGRQDIVQVQYSIHLSLEKGLRGKI